MADTSEARDVLLNELADEFAARQRAGERPRLEEYCDRHPDLAGDIRLLFPALAELEQAAADAGPELAGGDAPPVTRLGDFRLIREVGRGGMGVVYEAEQLSLGRRVAIKLLLSAVFRDPSKRRRFEREAKAAARLHHTNIVPVHGFGDHDGTPYYVMQFIPGLGLDAVVDELGLSSGRPVEPDRRPAGGRSALSVALARSLVGEGGRAPGGDAPTLTGAGAATPEPAPPPRPDRGSSAALSASGVHLPGQSGSGAGDAAAKRTTYWESVARIGVQVAGALAYAHKLGVLHRDIKPANLLLDLDGIVWVTDFGLAKAEDSDNLTDTGDLLGTLRYMPPEAFEGKSDARSDLYSLGLTLFELVALRPAYPERDRNKVIRQLTTGEPPRLRGLRPDAPRDLVTIVEKAIDRDPARRYQTAGALADDLQRFLDGRPIAARRATELERLWMWARRRPATAGLVAALLLCLLAGSVVSTAFAVRANGFARDAELRERDARVQRDRADREKAIAQVQRERADGAAEVAQQHLYYAQMHLAPEMWRGGHQSLSHMRDLLANWLPRDGSPDRRGWEWFYLNSLPFQNLRTLTESKSQTRPTAVAWHVASRRLAEGTAEGSIRVWDVDRERTTLTLNGPAPVHAYFGLRWLAWSPDGGRLAAGFEDGTVRVWATDTGRELTILRGQKTRVVAVAFGSDGARVAAWGQDGAITVWDADTGRLTATVTHPGGVVNAGAWSPDDKLLATGHADGTVTVSGTRAGDKVVTLRGGFAPITSLAWSPDGARLAATSSFDYAARVWEVASGKVVLGPLLHTHEATTLAWEPGGKRLATGSIDETVKVWDAATGREALTLRGNPHAITSLAWGPDGRLASGAIDGSVRIWTAVRDQESGALSGHAGRAHSAAWSPDGKWLASGGDDGKVRICDAATGEEVLTLKAHDESRVNGQFGLIRSLAWSPDGTRLASAGLDGTAKVWDVANDREVFALPADHGPVWSVAWSPDGTSLAAGSEDGSVRVVEGLKDSPRVRVVRAHRGRARALAWSPRGDCLASGGEDRLVKLWDPVRGAEIGRLQGHQHWVLAVAWSPDGKRLASGSSDLLLIAWDVEARRKVATVGSHYGWVEAVAWSPDGTRLASAGTDNSVRVCDPQTGQETIMFRGKSGMFHDVSWHPDGARLAAAQDDGRVWIWDATRGFERDTTARALPFIGRRVATGTARGEDRLAFARTAYGQKDFALATRLWAEALECDPALAEDRQTRHRYDAARAAAMAAAGQGEGGPPLDDTARANLRRQALDWLKAERTALAQLLESGSPQMGPEVAAKLNEWKEDGALAGVRDAAALAKLPADERQAFARLWADVRALDTTVLLLQSAAPPLLRTAALQAWLGQDKELAATCDRALRVGRDTKDPTTAERVAKICSLRQSDNRTHDAALVLARRAVELGQGHGYLVYFQMGLGMAEYRSGHYAEAIAALLTASRLGSSNYPVAITSAFYRAMSLFRLGKEDEARELAVAAAAKMKPLPEDEKNPLAGDANADDLILWLAYKEAKARIRFEAAPAAPGPRKK